MFGKTILQRSSLEVELESAGLSASNWLEEAAASRCALLFNLGVCIPHMKLTKIRLLVGAFSDGHSGSIISTPFKRARKLRLGCQG